MIRLPYIDAFGDGTIAADICGVDLAVNGIGKRPDRAVSAEGCL
jgi:hypothetical protein